MTMKFAILLRYKVISVQNKHEDRAASDIYTYYGELWHKLTYKNR